MISLKIRVAKYRLKFGNRMDIKRESRFVENSKYYKLYIYGIKAI
jgi:hypothetical protein